MSLPNPAPLGPSLGVEKSFAHISLNDSTVSSSSEEGAIPRNLSSDVDDTKPDKVNKSSKGKGTKPKKVPRPIISSIDISTATISTATSVAASLPIPPSASSSGPQQHPHPINHNTIAANISTSTGTTTGGTDTPASAGPTGTGGYESPDGYDSPDYGKLVYLVVCCSVMSCLFMYVFSEPVLPLSLLIYKYIHIPLSHSLPLSPLSISSHSFTDLLTYTAQSCTNTTHQYHRLRGIRQRGV